jgi:hypothetical protein
VMGTRDTQAYLDKDRCRSPETGKLRREYQGMSLFLPREFFDWVDYTGAETDKQAASGRKQGLAEVV